MNSPLLKNSFDSTSKQIIDLLLKQRAENEKNAAPGADVEVTLGLTKHEIKILLGLQRLHSSAVIELRDFINKSTVCSAELPDDISCFDLIVKTQRPTVVKNHFSTIDELINSVGKIK